jgi:hypothetical protein
MVSVVAVDGEVGSDVRDAVILGGAAVPVGTIVDSAVETDGSVSAAGPHPVNTARSKTTAVMLARCLSRSGILVSLA